MAKIEYKNNGCAEVAFADITGNIILPPGKRTIEIPDESVNGLINSLKRRAPYVSVRLLIDETKPEKVKAPLDAPPNKRPSRKRKPGPKKPKIEFVEPESGAPESLEKPDKLSDNGGIGNEE